MEDNLIINLRPLLIHSLNETGFYDQAIDLIRVPALKSAFAKYLWMRGEHIVGIRSFLLRANCKLSEFNFANCPDPAAWEAFRQTINKHDTRALLRWGMQKGHVTLRKYESTLSHTAENKQLSCMLDRHMKDIRTSLDNLSTLKFSFS